MKRLLLLLALSIGFNFNFDLHSMKRKRDHSQKELVQPSKKRKLDDIDFSVRTGIIGRTPVVIDINQSPITKNIEDLRVGDTVWSGPRNTKTRILDIHNKKIHDVVFIQTQSGQLILDPDKPFFNPQLEIWIRARSLTSNDVFLDANLKCIRIKAVKSITLKKSLQIYDLTLDSPHVFFICDSAGNSILVHNEIDKLEMVVLGGSFLGCTAAYIATNGAILAAATGSGAAATASGGVTAIVLTVAAPVLVPAAVVAGTGAGIYWGYKGIKSFFHHRKCLDQQRTIDRNSADLAMTTPSPFQEAEMDRVFNEVSREVRSEMPQETYFLLNRSNDDYEPVDLPIIDTTRKEGDRRGGPGGNRPPKRSAKEEERLLKEGGYKGPETNSRRLIKGYKSRIKQIKEHEQKMEDYKANTSANDNQGHYNRAKTPIQRAKVIDTRVKHLMTEIKTFNMQALEILKGLRLLGMNI